MIPIVENPFRMLGIAITASERKIIKSVSDLSLFAEMGESEAHIRDFPFLEDAERTSESVKAAYRQIEQPENKLFFSLFWFWENNRTDMQALEQLKKGEIEKSLSLWTSHKEMASNLKNLGVLYLGLSASARFPSHGRLNFFLKGIALLGQFLSSPLFVPYVQAVLGNGPAPDRKNISRRVADEICHVFKAYPTDKTAVKTFLSAFRTFPDGIFSYATRKLVAQPIQRTEAAIADTREKRSHAPGNADQHGEALVRTVLSDLAYLQHALPGDDLQYQVIADKLANEILQCAIDYFNEGARNTHEHDPGRKALKLVNSAASVGVGERIRNRIQENLPVMEAWVRAAPARARQKDIRLLMNDIADQLKRVSDGVSFHDRSRLETAQTLLDHCINKLLLIRESPDVSHAVCLELSSAVADSIMNLCMAHAHETRAYAATLRLMQQVGTLEMSSEVRNAYEDRTEQLNTSRENEMVSAIHAASEADEKEGYCYIATMAYGDYEAAELMVLRRFRDEVLSSYAFGKKFIRFYYKYSPGFVKRFGNSEQVNKAIRFLLDHLILKLDTY